LLTRTTLLILDQNTSENYALARKAVQESATLVIHANDSLPLSKTEKVKVVLNRLDIGHFSVLAEMRSLSE
jgi:hypothetical protein